MSFLQVDLDLEQAVSDTLGWNRIAMGGEFDLSHQRKDLQHRCLLEEVQELRDALDSRDKVETVDALCDILFVGVFAWFMHNDRNNGTIDIDVLAWLVHSDINNGAIDIGGLDHSFVDTTFSLEDLYTQLYKLVSDKKYKTVCELIVQTSILFDFDLKKSYEEVVRSNFSKFPLKGNVDIISEIYYFKHHSKYDNVVGVIVDGRYTFRCEDGLGKIVKPRAFSEPQLTQYIGGL